MWLVPEPELIRTLIQLIAPYFKFDDFDTTQIDSKLMFGIFTSSLFNDF